MPPTAHTSETTEDLPKNVVMEELKKCRMELAGINSSLANKTIGNSAGMVSNLILLEIRDILGTMAEKQERIEKNQRKTDKKVGRLEETVLENRKIIEHSIGDNRKVQIEINQKIEENQKDLCIKMQKTLETMDSSKESLKISGKKDNSTNYFSALWGENSFQDFVTIRVKGPYSDEVFSHTVKKSLRMNVLDEKNSEIWRILFYFMEYSVKDQNGQVKTVNENSTFAEANIKNGDVISITQHFQMHYFSIIFGVLLPVTFCLINP